MTTAAQPAAADLRPIGPCLYELGRAPGSAMRVPARVFADEVLLTQIVHDRSISQLVNVTTLPGIVDAALGMPDMHEGYGFPVGGVAATELPDGVISPGGIGFDINCGVRLLVSGLREEDVHPSLEALVHEMSRSVPAGYGRHGRLALTREEMDRVLGEGCPYLVREHGLGRPEDLPLIESGGVIASAAPGAVSERAKQRGEDQLGTLGGGNHFIEVQVVDAIFDAPAAEALGVSLGQVTVLVHTGSRGLGHQVCTDHVKVMDTALHRYGITVPDRQLACVPLSSPEGQRYFGAMCAAVNFAFCNREVIAHRAREVFRRVLHGAPAAELRLVYDVAHNTAKIERHGDRTLCVHRKGATRAFGPSSAEIPEAYRGVGQPVLIPGSMGTASYLLVGTDAADALSFSSTCHGAGRAMSRGAAKRRVQGHVLRKELLARGIVVRCPSNEELAEEAPLAYKDVDRVVDVVHRAGLARKVARLRPIGVVKG
ncbi:RtcB family protein [Anaeromyxobacter terrae]|uniref:RtcB family protein n=1 Tax=Anaeromyxobacter terrae TaxID=2925406 RepID=UPI0024372649|nr:RtcB family protein [Anaeromyxobacter sp. SG22]